MAGRDYYGWSLLDQSWLTLIRVIDHDWWLIELPYIGLYWFYVQHSGIFNHTVDKQKIIL